MKSHPVRGSGPSTTGYVIAVKQTKKTHFLSFSNTVSHSGKILTERTFSVAGSTFLWARYSCYAAGQPALVVAELRCYHVLPAGVPLSFHTY